MNSKSRRFLLYALCAIMALTQVAFVGLRRDDTSDESVINGTNEIESQDITTITETKETTENILVSVDATEGTTSEVAMPEGTNMEIVTTGAAVVDNVILDNVDASGLDEVIVVESEEGFALMEEEYLGVDEDAKTSKYQDQIVSYADPYLCVRSIADKDGKLIGKMYPGSYADIVERGEEWTKIKSGKVEGYIRNIYVCFDDEAEDLAGQIRGKLSTALTMEEDAKRNAAPTGGGSVSASSSDVALLAAIIDWEANNECYEGKVAVGTVVLNRVKSGRYPNSIQAVLLAPGQFGGVMSGGGFSSAFQQRINKYTSGQGKADCIKAANDALAGANPLNGTYYYFNTSVGAVSQMQQIGNHIFYNY